MSYSILQTIAVICYMIAVGFLAVAVLIFFLWDMRDIIGRITGSSQRKALARMRSDGSVGRTGAPLIDASLLEKKDAVQTSTRLGRRTSRTNRDSAAKKPPAYNDVPAPKKQEPAPQPSATASYFGTPYPNKTPPTPIAPAPAPSAETAPMPSAETMPMPNADVATAPLREGETMDLEQWQRSQAAVEDPGTELLVAEEDVQPVRMTVLDDILLVHTESFIEI